MHNLQFYTFLVGIQQANEQPRNEIQGGVQAQLF
jgi:hypothetical protein